MARRKADAPLTDFDFNAVEVADSAAMPARAAREEKPNPLLSAVAASLESKSAKVLPRVPQAALKDAQNYLRHAAVKLDCGIEIRPTDNGDGTVAVHFRAKDEKRARAYTVAEVRAWAEVNGFGEDVLYPKIQTFVSDAYRAAHGLKPVKRSSE
jgi:hypothetical protein